VPLATILPLVSINVRDFIGLDLPLQFASEADFNDLIAIVGDEVLKVADRVEVDLECVDRVIEIEARFMSDLALCGEFHWICPSYIDSTRLLSEPPTSGL